MRMSVAHGAREARECWHAPSENFGRLSFAAAAPRARPAPRTVPSSCPRPPLGRLDQPRARGEAAVRRIARRGARQTQEPRAGGWRKPARCLCARRSRTTPRRAEAWIPARPATRARPRRVYRRPQRTARGPPRPRLRCPSPPARPAKGRPEPRWAPRATRASAPAVILRRKAALARQTPPPWSAAGGIPVRGPHLAAKAGRRAAVRQ